MIRREGRQAALGRRLMRRSRRCSMRFDGPESVRGARMEMTQSAGSVRQRGWYHGWNIVAVCVLSQVAANGLAYNAFSLFLRDWSADLHDPVSRLQLAVAAMALLAALFSSMVGALSDYFPAFWLFAR